MLSGNGEEEDYGGVVITGMRIRDVRFHTSKGGDGSDAMSPDPEYSTVYTTLETSDPSLVGVGLAFSIGRGNETIAMATEILRCKTIGVTLREIATDFRSVWRRITSDGQMKWIGPEKGPVHQAAAGIINAMWDLWAKYERKPVWKLIADLSPERLVACLDFSYVDDACSEDEALEILRESLPFRADREREMRERGYPAYTTSTGWLGWPDEKVRRKCQEALAQGFTAFKMKVGTSCEDDCRRAELMRSEIGWGNTLMMDANAVWSVNDAIENMRVLARYRPYWIEEPTNPDDILGHAKIQKALSRYAINVATGEQCSNRVMHKQFLQAGGYNILQTDVQRLAGINEYIVVALMAHKFGVKVCLHAGGIGLCNMAAHLCAIDFINICGTMEGRTTEYIDHLQEHFVDDLVVRNARYLAPVTAGFGLTMKDETLDEMEYPSGPYWSARPGHFDRIVYSSTPATADRTAAKAATKEGLEQNGTKDT